MGLLKTIRKRYLQLGGIPGIMNPYTLILKESLDIIYNSQDIREVAICQSHVDVTHNTRQDRKLGKK